MSHLETAKTYLKARQEADIDACLTLVSDDIKLVSSKDGTFEG